MTHCLSVLHDLVWGAPALLMILGVGIYLSIRTGFAQLRFFPKAMKVFFCRIFQRETSVDGVSSFQALCTALAATVGTGNLVGVAGAICLGGPGSIFWMWICGILGMITKFAEVSLAVHYRVRESGEWIGGPMYMISRGMGKHWKWLAKCYCLFGVIAAFGVGNATQVNAVLSGINSVLSGFGYYTGLRRNIAVGILLAVLVGAMLLGGAKRIGLAAERLIPFVSLFYILLCTGILLLRLKELPAAFSAIVRGAFTPRAVTGGMIGSSFRALRVGCSRGVFTNEAGMGTASIAHASAGIVHPVEQGLMGIVEVFLDTIVICTLTALVILASGVPIPYSMDAGGQLTIAAFVQVYGDWVSIAITAALCCFAFATVLGWGLYGARCAQFLFGSKAWNIFALLQTATVLLGSVLNTQTVWLFAETVNGLMAIPNLIALAALSPVLIRLTKEYRKSNGKAVSGGNYADFHQRKPLRALSYAEIPSSGNCSQERGKKDLSSEHRST